jgi:cullin 4
MALLLLAEAPQLPSNFEQGTWSTLERAVVSVQRAKPVGTSLEELYQAVESLCIHQYSEKLYQNLYQTCDGHIAELVAGLNQHVAKGPVALLCQMRACWDRHCEQMLLIRSIFLYLDRSIVLAADSSIKRSIFDMGLFQFRQHLEAQPKVIVCTRPYDLKAKCMHAAVVDEDNQDVDIQCVLMIITCMQP